MEDEELVFITPADVAARDGITKQAVTKLVRTLVDQHDIPVERDGRGRIVRFSQAHFDHHRERFGSSEKTTAARKSSKPVAGPCLDPASRDEALRQEAWLKVTRAKLQQQEERGALIRSDILLTAVQQCGREIQSAVARLPNHSDDLAMEVSKEGAHGLRVALRKIAFDLNQRVAEQLEGISDNAPVSDPMIEEVET
ncbi:hypothetical protein [Roseibium algae]|uniref:Phage terminase Nu1 subunit (DNA packaging protein) n=1 Tax=Roseibium algae TaxID=3123038 RepID=A0ABU8TK04_9HYPH